MRKLCVLFATIWLLISCQKENNQVDTSTCESQMVERFSKELKCFNKGTMEVNLYRGLYKNKQVYFPMTMCINCGTLPPEFGYTCENEKITFENFEEVKNTKQVYNSCTKEFID